MILDNYGTHGHPKVNVWLSSRKRFHLHFVPTGSSWLNLIEVWFSQLTKRAIQLDQADRASDVRLSSRKHDHSGTRQALGDKTNRSSLS